MVVAAELLLHLLEMEAAVADPMPRLLEVEVAVAVWLLLCLPMVWAFQRSRWEGGDLT